MPVEPVGPLALLALLAGLQIKHWLFDFVFQSDWQVHNKGRYGHPGGLVHAGLHGAGTLVVLALGVVAGLVDPLLAGILALVDCVAHYHVDWTKAQISRRLAFTPDRKPFWIAIGADQAAHQITYLGLMLALTLV